MVSRYITREGAGPRDTILYAGDMDPHGFAIEADFARRVPSARIIRVALTRAQANTMGPGGGPLPRLVGNASRDQVEVDALDPDVLIQLFRDALTEHGFDFGWVAEIVAKEEAAVERVQEALQEIADAEEADAEEKSDRRRRTLTASANQ